MASILQEPLVQFLIVGCLLFAADTYISVNREDPNLIIVDDKRLEKLIDIFRQGQGRLPNQEEVDSLIVKWTQNEIFYREALALNLDDGDEMMRSRLILKMRNILFNRVMETPPAEEQLQEWFELNRSQYDIPTRYSFEQFPLDGVTNLEQAKALANQVNQQGPSTENLGMIRQYPRRPRTNLQSLFGVEGAKILVDGELNSWLPVRSQTSWHLARVYEISPPVPAQFESVRSKVVRAYKKAASGLQVSEMVDDISSKYQIYLDFDNQGVDTLLAAAAAQKNSDSPISADSRNLKARAGVAETSTVP